jgi:hypothetical protein
VEREVIVVLYRAKGGRFAKKTEVMNGDRVGENELQSCEEWLKMVTEEEK